MQNQRWVHVLLAASMTFAVVGCGDSSRQTDESRGGSSKDAGTDAGGPPPAIVSPKCTVKGGGAPDAGSDAGTELECTCPDGYALELDKLCHLVNLCDTDNGGCDFNATCTPGINSRTCACNTGYYGNGETCIKDCENCDKDASCQRGEFEAVCVCKEGYEGNGFDCTMLDPCPTNNGGCDEHATCSFIDEMRKCECWSEYEGDGVTCTKKGQNPCTTNNGGCSANATCANNNGTAVCTCNMGYSGNGKTCNDVNECTNHADCDANASCQNTVGSYTCTCNEGYEGNGKTCTPDGSDPCLVNNGGCNKNATCGYDAWGDMTCTCNSGYTGDGWTCTAVATNVAVGGDCSSTGVQSNCASGLTCEALDNNGTNMCTKTCSANSNCGTNGSYQNTCLGAPNGYCFRGCSTTIANTCGRTGFGCYSVVNGTTATNYCDVDCRNSSGTCTYGSTCNQTSGGCVQKSCTSNASCASGQVCGDMGNGTKLCAPNCKTAGNSCPSGRTCNQTTGFCDKPAVTDFYKVCSVDGDCSSGYCVHYSSGNTKGVCMPICSADTDCPSSPRQGGCDLQYGSDLICALDCSSACPTGSTCQDLGGGEFFCLP